VFHRQTGTPTRIAAAALVAVVASSLALAQDINSRHSEKEVRRLVSTAHTADDYRNLAEHFHEEKQLYRAKACAEMRDYARWFSRYHPKSPTGVDRALRMYQTYVDKADRAQKLAAYYDGLLVRNGREPATERLTVSAVNLESFGMIAPPANQMRRSAFGPLQTAAKSSGSGEHP
jgi:hypothetical protein